jgi:hypothetical protein
VSPAHNETVISPRLRDLLSTPEPQPGKQWIEFCTPSQLRDYKPPEGAVLVGDFHIVRGAVFVIGGAPGVGKSRAGVALAVSGASGSNWFGLSLHRRFRTLIVQNENGRLRLCNEFAGLPCDELSEYVRVSPPPPYGLNFDSPEFQQQLQAAVAEFKPDVVLIDPWNAVARDEKARDYLETFNLIRSVIPGGDDGPAIGIVAHTRKPKPDERANGRSLLNLLSGSYVLGSVPRSVFIIQAAADDPEDPRIVFTCCKNNDGPLGKPSAWERGNGVFEAVMDFDWKEFYGSEKSRRVITEEDMAALFRLDGRTRMLDLAKAAKELQDRTRASRATCYNALKSDGPFAARLHRDGNLLSWR